jgi:hypothetical protein
MLGTILHKLTHVCQHSLTTFAAFMAECSDTLVRLGKRPASLHHPLATGNRLHF